jgi:hypothetical protein
VVRLKIKKNCLAWCGREDSDRVGRVKCERCRRVLRDLLKRGLGREIGPAAPGRGCAPLAVGPGRCAAGQTRRAGAGQCRGRAGRAQRYVARGARRDSLDLVVEPARSSRVILGAPPRHTHPVSGGPAGRGRYRSVGSASASTGGSQSTVTVAASPAAPVYAAARRFRTWQSRAGDAPGSHGRRGPPTTREGGPKPRALVLRARTSKAKSSPTGFVTNGIVSSRLVTGMAEETGPARVPAVAFQAAYETWYRMSVKKAGSAPAGSSHAKTT